MFAVAAVRSVAAASVIDPFVAVIVTDPAVKARPPQQRIAPGGQSDGPGR